MLHYPNGKEPVLKTGDGRKSTVGSNPTLSAKINWILLRPTVYKSVVRLKGRSLFAANPDTISQADTLR